MKNLYLLMGILISTFVFSQTQNRIVGNWQGVDSKGIKNSVSFSKDGYFSLHVKDLNMVGKKTLIQKGPFKGKFSYIKYQLDETTDPAKILIKTGYFEGNEEVEKGTLNGIVRFTNDKEMDLYLDMSGKDAATFEEADKNQIVHLKKISK